MKSEVLIRARKLTKKYDDFVAVDNIEFEVFKGECCGFLGPNGAGKTTTIKMINCVLPLTTGQLTVADLSVTENSREIKRMIGVAPQENNLDPDFTVLNNLVVYARYFDISKEEALKRSQDLLKFFQLEEKTKVVIDELSTGMKRRLLLARALINTPQILLLDEPTTGLDPQARHLIWDKVRELKKSGVTIILTTHYMDEATELCDRTLIMDKGKIIEEGSPSALIQKHIGEEVLEVDYDENVLTAVKEKLPEARIEILSDRIHVFSFQPHGVFERFVENSPAKGATIRQANLEDVFLKLTGRGLRE
ncbi:MAG TPA: ATP-binding cassette domain-containing protein [Candidatus Acidoferrum sp.]|nr:ATP-binding cassette domain-containing protein [Candidatus Acidoferrum sp.]